MSAVNKSHKEMIQPDSKCFHGDIYLSEAGMVEDATDGSVLLSVAVYFYYINGVLVSSCVYKWPLSWLLALAVFTFTGRHSNWPVTLPNQSFFCS